MGCSRGKSLCEVSLARLEPVRTGYVEGQAWPRHRPRLLFFKVRIIIIIKRRPSWMHRADMKRKEECGNEGQTGEGGGANCIHSAGGHAPKKTPLADQGERRWVRRRCGGRATTVALSGVSLYTSHDRRGGGGETPTTMRRGNKLVDGSVGETTRAGSTASSHSQIVVTKRPPATLMGTSTENLRVDTRGTKKYQSIVHPVHEHSCLYMSPF